MYELSSRFTPVNDADPGCERTEATLAIYNVDPALVTRRLGVTPTMSQAIGIPRIMPSGKKDVGRINSWLLSTEDSHVVSKDIRTHLDWLLDRIEPAAAQLRELQQYPDVKMTIWCIWWEAEGGGPTLWPEQMRRMANLNLECGFSFACYGDDEDK